MQYNRFWKFEKIPCGFIELWKVDRVLGGTAGRRGIRRGGLHFFSVSRNQDGYEKLVLNNNSFHFWICIR